MVPHVLGKSLVAMTLFASPALAVLTTFIAFLSGLNEEPPNASLGTGITTVTIDPAAHTMTTFAMAAMHARRRRRAR